MYKYKLTEGNENRVFVGAQTLEDGTILSETPIFSPYVTEVSSPEQVAQPVNQPAAAPAQVAPATTAPVQAPQPTNGELQ